MAKRATKGDYEVGRGKPSKAHQWRPGQSGNLKGRPKGKMVSQDDYLRMLRDLPVPISGDDKPLPARAAMYRVAMGKALKGDLKAIQYLETEFRRIEDQTGKHASDLPMSESDQDLMRQYLQQNGFLDAGTALVGSRTADNTTTDTAETCETRNPDEPTGTDGEGR